MDEQEDNLITFDARNGEFTRLAEALILSARLLDPAERGCSRLSSHAIFSHMLQASCFGCLGSVLRDPSKMFTLIRKGRAVEAPNDSVGGGKRKNTTRSNQEEASSFGYPGPNAHQALSSPPGSRLLKSGSSLSGLDLPYTLREVGSTGS